MKNILVAVDLEQGDILLLNKAAELALCTKAKVWVVHIAMPDPDFVGMDAGPMYVRKTLADDLRTEHKALRAYHKELHDQRVPSEALLIQGPTVETIFAEASKLDADLIVIGAHKHNFLKRVFGQDITHQIIDQSRIPMLVVPLD
ncbi:MAG: universal stress protein [Bacteroidetes bacterium]|nr:universal stress protein [Bacteroidota bacterium]